MKTPLKFLLALLLPVLAFGKGILINPGSVVAASGGGGGSGDTSFITGQTVGTLRADFTASVGMQVTIAGTDVVVTQLGRWVISGNSQTHILRIYSDPFGTPTLLGSVTVNTSGATAGAYLYGTLSSPVTLTASTAYVIVSDETNGGDQWSGSDASVTHTAVATVDQAVYRGGATGGSGTFGAGGSTNNAFGPIAFKYSSP